MPGSTTTRTTTPKATKAHAKQFLAPLRAEPTFEGVATLLMEEARADQKLAKQFMDLQDLLGNGQPLLTPDQGRRLAAASVASRLDLPSAPDWLRPAIVAGYLRARDHLTPAVAAKITADPAAALRRTRGIVKKLEPGFVGELLVELAEDEAAYRPRLKAGAKELKPLVADLYQNVPASTIRASARASGGGGGESCQGCDANGNCTPISCWVIVIIIVIVIVTK